MTIPQPPPQDQEPRRDSPFNANSFWISFIVCFVVHVYDFFARYADSGYLIYNAAGYVALSILIWLMLRKTNRPIALGILFGFLSPLIILGILLGGCFVIVRSLMVD
jgi:hypothetical protein